MFNDISNATDKAAANFLAALGLSVYTEVMGGLVTGELRSQHRARANYEAFLNYMGSPYLLLDKQVGLYDRVRCGLAHEYFIKGPSIIARTIVDPVTQRPDTVPGIVYAPPRTKLAIQTDRGLVQLPRDTIAFGIRNYLRDFQQAAENYYSDLLQPSNAPLVQELEKALLP